MRYVLIVGAKSDIAKAIAKKYAENRFNLYLAARNSGELESFANDLFIRNDIKVNIIELDVLNFASHQSIYDSLIEKPIGVISVAGYLGEQEQAQNNFNELERIINTNYTGIVSLLNIIANDFEKRKSGFVVGITSVAGDRGRKSNFIYGSAKAAFATYLSGLRNRLFNSNVHVMTVKPGFVATKMTAVLNLPKKLTAQPKDVANDIFKAQQKGRNVIYSNWFWRYIMLVIKNIPEFQFKRMSI